MIDGVVKNITDYGAFVDLGGIDGLLHVTDLSYKRVNHPSEVINIGDTVKVQIIRINRDTQRISLGMKQLESDPWEGVAAKYPVGAKLTGRVTNITEYGAFVELEAGIEGLVHVSEMSWTKKNVHPGKIVSTSQEVDVVVLEVDAEKRRISPRPQAGPAQPVGSVRRQAPGRHRPSKAKSRTPPSSACSSASTATSTAWSTCRTSPGASRVRTRSTLHRKGESVTAIVLDVDVDKERITLGMKQLEKGAPAAAAGVRPADGLNKNEVVTVTVLEVRDGGLEVQVGDDGATGFIKRSRPRPRPRRAASERFAGRPEARRDGHRLRPFEEAATSRSRRSRSPKRSRLLRSTARRIRARRSATSSAKRSRPATRRTKTGRDGERETAPRFRLTPEYHSGWSCNLRVDAGC